MRGQKIIYYSFAALTLLAILSLFIPVQQKRIVTPGVDAYNAHLPIFASQTKSQEIKLDGELIGAGAILVDLKRQNNLSDVTVRATDLAAKQTLGTATIAKELIADDKFSFAYFPRPIKKNQGSVNLSFSAPSATAANPIGIRTEYDTAKTLAIMAIERVPVWQLIRTATQTNQDKLLPVIWSLLAAFVLAVLSVQPGWRTRSKQVQKRIELVIIVSFMLISVTVHINWLNKLYGVSGGDPYNYLSITRTLVHGENPFGSGEKRLPGLPLLLTPFFNWPAIDLILVMRLIEVFSAALILLVIYGLAKTLRLPWPIPLAVPALLMTQKDFFWTALRPEPYTFYALLALLNILLFLNIKRKGTPWLFGLTLGYAAMTRHEGFVLAASLSAWLFILCLMRHNRQMLPRYALSFALAAMIVVPYFVNNFIAYGNPFYTPYFAGERLQIVDSWPAWQDNMSAAWDIFSSMWHPQWKQLTSIDFSHPTFSLAVLGTIGWWFINTRFNLYKTIFNLVSLTVSLIIIVVIPWLVTANTALFANAIAPIMAGVLVASIPLFLSIASWRGLLFLLAILIQMLTAAWFHPFAKHFQPVYPLISLMIAASLMPRAAGSSQFDQISQLIKTWAVLTPFLLVAGILAARQNTLVDVINQDTAADNVIYRAIKVMRRQNAPLGFDGEYQPTFVFFGDEAKTWRGEGANMENNWLKENNIATLMTTNIMPAFARPPNGWQRIASFKAEGDDEKIYESAVWIRSN